MNDIRLKQDFYTDGIEFCGPNGMKNSLVCTKHGDSENHIKLAVFDMDGTILNASSPLLLVKKLFSERRIRAISALHILSWAIAYKFQLPRQNNPVRQRVFESFEGKSWQEVNCYLSMFFENDVKKFVRDKAKAEIKKCRDDGLALVLLSASFDSVASMCIKDLRFDYGIATLMEIDKKGNYTNRVEGVAPEGEGKKTTLCQFCDENFGKGNWSVERAYGDHLSDKFVLEMASKPFAVSPDKQLEKHAKEHSWNIVDWSY